MGKSDFDIKEFERWWKKQKENDYKIDQEISEALEKARVTLQQIARLGKM